MSETAKRKEREENGKKKWKTQVESCPNREFFLVRIFPYSVQIPENADQEKLRIWTLFMQ